MGMGRDGGKKRSLGGVEEKRIMGKGEKRRKRVDGVVDLQGRGVNVIK